MKLAAFLLPLWAALAQIPTPESVLGHKPGDDFFLASYDDSLGYFQKLAKATDKLKLVRVGKTTRGLEWYIAIISSPQNLAKLDQYKDTAKKLALVKGLTDAQARDLARSGKVIVHIDGGLHATEVAHAQHTIQLAYNLVTGTDPEIVNILDNSILLLWFSINPDGQNQVASWYRSNLGTQYEVSNLPGLYQEYVGHDNNRDGYMNNMIESQVITRDQSRILPRRLLQPPPDRALPRAHLDPALRRPGLAQSTPADVSLGERLRHGHGRVPRRARYARRHAPRPLRRLVSRLRRSRE